MRLPAPASRSASRRASRASPAGIARIRNRTGMVHRACVGRERRHERSSSTVASTPAAYASRSRRSNPLPRTRCPIRVRRDEARPTSFGNTQSVQIKTITRTPSERKPTNLVPSAPGRRLARCHPVGRLGNAVHPTNCRARPDHDHIRSPAKNRRDSSKRILAELRRTGLLRS